MDGGKTVFKWPKSFGEWLAATITLAITYVIGLGYVFEAII